MSWVTVLAGTAQEPGWVASANSGNDWPLPPMIPPSWTTYWKAPSDTVKPRAMTKPGGPEKTTLTEVFEPTPSGTP